MRLAKGVSSRIFFMDQGGIHEDGTPDQIFEHPRSERTKNFIYRVRSWEYAVAANVDFYGMMASLESFCRLQFMGRKASNNCQLAVEEIVMEYLLPVLRKNPDKSVVIRIDAGEEENVFSLIVDARELPWKDILTGDHDELANILLRNLLKRMPDREPGVAVFARQ
jgi:polar amino acid transport system ATP-binding protein